jgi:hypothetical protein
MEFSDTLVFQAAGKQVSNPLPVGVVILNLSNGVYYTLNEVGALIWQHLQQPQTIRTLREGILAEYDISPEQAQADLAAFITKLLESRLVEVVYDQSG